MKDQNNGLNIWVRLIVILIGLVGITGFGAIDSEITKWVVIIIGWIAYSIVGWMYSSNVIKTKQAGRDAYSAIFIIFAIGFFCVYLAVLKLVEWIKSLLLWIKVTIPSAILMIIIGIIIYLIIKNHIEKKKNNMKEVVKGQNDDKKE